MRLSDASWIVPLLQAVAEGKTLQIKQAISWCDYTSNTILFNHELGREGYRIKPKSLKYRKFLSLFIGSIRIGLSYNEDFCRTVEADPNFIRWIDTEWQEVEL